MCFMSPLAGPCLDVLSWGTTINVYTTYDHPTAHTAGVRAEVDVQHPRAGAPAPAEKGCGETPATRLRPGE